MFAVVYILTHLVTGAMVTVQYILIALALHRPHSLQPCFFLP